MSRAFLGVLAHTFYLALDLARLSMSKPQKVRARRLAFPSVPSVLPDSAFRVILSCLDSVPSGLGFWPMCPGYDFRALSQSTDLGNDRRLNRS